MLPINVVIKNLLNSQFDYLQIKSRQYVLIEILIVLYSQPPYQTAIIYSTTQPIDNALLPCT